MIKKRGGNLSFLFAKKGYKCALDYIYKKIIKGLEVLMLPGNFKELVQETGAELVWVAGWNREDNGEIQAMVWYLRSGSTLLEKSICVGINQFEERDGEVAQIDGVKVYIGANHRERVLKDIKKAVTRNKICGDRVKLSNKYKGGGSTIDPNVQNTRLRRLKIILDRLAGLSKVSYKYDRGFREFHVRSLGGVTYYFGVNYVFRVSNGREYLLGEFTPRGKSVRTLMKEVQKDKDSNLWVSLMRAYDLRRKEGLG
ncbi:hypothetical protein ABEX45_00180 [Bacillus subtilis]